jgi:hypothetical protein
MELGVRMKAAAGEKLLLAAHSSDKVYVLGSRNIAQHRVLAIGCWDRNCLDTGVASIGASSIHTHLLLNHDKSSLENGAVVQRGRRKEEREKWSTDKITFTGEKQTTQRKTCPTATLSTTYPMDWPLIVNLGFRSGRTVTDCLRHSVAPSVEAGGLYGSARPQSSHQKTEIL